MNGKAIADQLGHALRPTNPFNSSRNFLILPRGLHEEPIRKKDYKAFRHGPDLNG